MTGTKRTQQRSWKLHIFKQHWGGTGPVDTPNCKDLGYRFCHLGEENGFRGKKRSFKTPFIISAWIRAVKGHRLKRFQTRGTTLLFARWVPACYCKHFPTESTGPSVSWFSQMCCWMNVLTQYQAFEEGPYPTHKLCKVPSRFGWVTFSLLLFIFPSWFKATSIRGRTCQFLTNQVQNSLLNVFFWLCVLYLSHALMLLHPGPSSSPSTENESHLFLTKTPLGKRERRKILAGFLKYRTKKCNIPPQFLAALSWSHNIFL